MHQLLLQYKDLNIPINPNLFKIYFRNCPPARFQATLLDCYTSLRFLISLSGPINWQVEKVHHLVEGVEAHPFLVEEAAAGPRVQVQVQQYSGFSLYSNYPSDSSSVSSHAETASPSANTHRKHRPEVRSRLCSRR